MRVLRAYLGFLWCFVRVMVRAPSGRQRFNVLGALHAVTHELITVTNDILKKLSLVGKNLDDYSLETVKMFADDAVAAGFKL